MLGAIRAAIALMIEASSRRRRVVAALTAVLAPFVLALVITPSRSSLADPASALCFVALITSVAILGDRRSGGLASVSSAVWFDFYLTRPYDRLAISHRPDFETTICIVVVGLAVNELAAASRRSYERAMRKSDFVASVHELAVMVSDSSSLEHVVSTTTSSLVDVLLLRHCSFERVTRGHPYARILTSGAVAHVGLAWPTNEIGLPGPKTELLAQWRDRNYGRFVCVPTPGAPVPFERRIVAVVLASLCASAIAAGSSSVTTQRANSDT